MALDLRENERTILGLLSSGYERKEIAPMVDLSLSTVNNKIYEATKRNGLKTSTSLVAWYVREAVTDHYEAVIRRMQEEWLSGT